MTYERSEHPLKSIFPETKLSGYLTNSDPSVRLAPQGPLITPQAPLSPPHPSRPHPTNPLDPDQPNVASSSRTYLAHLVLFRPLFFAIENNLIYHQHSRNLTENHNSAKSTHRQKSSASLTSARQCGSWRRGGRAPATESWF